MKKNHALLFVLFVVLSLPVLGQNRLKEKADQYYERLNYSQAIEYYRRAYKKDKEDSETILRLAECYRLTHQYDSAAVWYDKAMATGDHDDEAHFHYAHTLLHQEDPDAAKKAFLKHANLNPDDPRGAEFAEALEKFHVLLQDSVNFKLDLLEFNSPETDFSIWPYGEGFVFASARDPGGAVKQKFHAMDEHFLRLYYIEFDEEKGEWSKPEELKGDVLSKFHESNFTSIEEGDGKVYFNRNNLMGKKVGKNDKGHILLKIYSVEMNDLKGENIQEFPYNSDHYNLAHPSLSPDGSKLFFTSDMEGGQGGKDIWYCEKEGDSWGEPINLGPEINTGGDEQFPFLHADGTFFFSSNGWPGLGYLDVFSVKFNATKKQVVNLGYPINSKYDDISFFLAPNEEEGYISSNRPGGKGKDDIYHFTVIRPEIRILVIDTVENEPVRYAQISVKDLFHNSVEEFKTDYEGRISFKGDFDMDYQANIKTEDYGEFLLDMSTMGDTGQQLVFNYKVEVGMQPPFLRALVVDAQTNEILPNSNFRIVEFNEVDSVFKKTDINGKVLVKLEPKKRYEVRVSREGYRLYRGSGLTSDAAYQGDTIIRLEKIPIKLDPIVLENIKYNFNEWTIRADAYNELQKIAKLLRDNPEIKVELSSHTDGRGDDAYNKRLSQLRANAARNFLILQCGVDHRRIVARGYGEEKPRVKCKPISACSEQEHQFNRRTELKVIGDVAGIDQERSILDTESDLGGKTTPEAQPFSPGADQN